MMDDVFIHVQNVKVIFYYSDFFSFDSQFEKDINSHDRKTPAARSFIAHRKTLMLKKVSGL